jgi:hypothetical protein
VASIDAGSGYLAVGGRLGSTLGLQGGISDLTVRSGASTLFDMHCATDLIGVDPVAAQFRTTGGQTVLVNRSSSPQLVLVSPVPVGSAVRFSAAANRYTRASFGLGATDLTICYWLKLMVAQATYSFSSSVDNGSGNYVQMGPANTGVNLGVSATTGGLAAGYDAVVGIWVFFAQVWTVAAAGDNLYYGVGGATVLTQATPSSWTGYNVASALWIGGDGFGDYFNGAVAAFKVWNAALTKTELEAEMKKYAAVRTANLYAAYQFRSGPQTADDSGNSRVLTQGGTAPTTDTFGPPCT